MLLWLFGEVGSVARATSDGQFVSLQVVVLDDLIEEDDKRVDVAPGEERRNLVFEYNIAEDAIYGAVFSQCHALS